jgi:hypothetical protein
MSMLSKRLHKLEGKGTDDLVVVITQFGDGEYYRVKGLSGQLVDRLARESEDAFLERARGEIVSTVKRQQGPQSCYVIQPLRKADKELATEPQLHPTVTRDEWLRAHGLMQIDSETSNSHGVSQ